MFLPNSGHPLPQIGMKLWPDVNFCNQIKIQGTIIIRGWFTFIYFSPIFYKETVKLKVYQKLTIVQQGLSY